GFEAPLGSQFMIVKNDGRQAIDGQFAGLAEGATLPSGGALSGRLFRISYVGGDGNDIVLTRIESPTFVGAIAAGDAQVYRSGLDAGTRQAGPWTLIAPGVFRNVVVTRLGTNNAPMVFGLGLDHQIYSARFNANGTLAEGWSLVAPGFFDDLAVTSY